MFLASCAGLERAVAGSVRIEDARDDEPLAPRLQARGRGLPARGAARGGPRAGPQPRGPLHPGRGARQRPLHRPARPPEERRLSRIAAYNIKGRPDSPVEALSGGNQQRALLALLRDDLSLILVEHPTRGLDIESTIYIWSKLKERCARGTAIVFISSDLDEILQYSDRVLVFFAGRVSPPLAADSLGVEELGRLIGGKGWERFEGRCRRGGHA